MSNKKFELINEDSIEFEGKKLFRIRAVSDFGDVKSGDLGGYVESESNLASDGKCWIADNAKVFGGAFVSQNAIVDKNAVMKDLSSARGNARVTDYAELSDRSQISDEGVVGDFSKLKGESWVNCESKVMGDIELKDKVHVSGTVKLNGYGPVFGGDMEIFGDSVNSLPVCVIMGLDKNGQNVVINKDGVKIGDKEYSMEQLKEVEQQNPEFSKIMSIVQATAEFNANASQERDLGEYLDEIIGKKLSPSPKLS